MCIYFRSSREGEESQRTGGREVGPLQSPGQKRGIGSKAMAVHMAEGKHERDAGARTEALVFSEQMWVKRKGPPPARLHVRVWMSLPQEAFPDPPAG